LLIQFLPARTTLANEKKTKMIDIGMPELLIVLVIIILIFGPGRIAKTMGEIGKGIRSFRDSFSTEDCL
jgi:sec-independent protein translocase protein TatA